MATLRQCRSSMPKFKFAPDSALEGDGFEPSVPRKGQHFSAKSPGGRQPVGMTPAVVGQVL